MMERTIVAKKIRNKKRPRKIIRVRIGSSALKSSSLQTISCPTNFEMGLSNRRQSTIRVSRISRCRKRTEFTNSFMKRSNQETNQVKENDWANPTDYDGKKKKNIKLSMREVIIFIASIMIFLIAISVMFILLFVKPKTTSLPSTAFLRWNKTGITIAGTTGISGTGSNQLQNPWGLVMTYDYNLYVGDRFNNRIQKYARGSAYATTVAGLANGTSGNSADAFSSPAAILIDSDENLYVADGYNYRIQFWSKNSILGTTIAGTGTPGIGLNELNFPYGVTRDPVADLLYIADTNNHRVMSYARGSTFGSLVAISNNSGFNINQINGPIGIHFDSMSTSLLIVNIANHNVVRWIVGQNSSTLVAGSAQGIPGNTTTLLRTPMAVTTDPMGNIYVADRSNHRIQFFSSDGSTGVTIAGINSQSGSNGDSLNQPFMIILDNQLNLYVSDNQNHRIQKFLRY